MQVATISQVEFAERFGCPDVRGALCGYTRELDTRLVLTLLVQANPRRVLEIGTAFGHMTANLCRWSGEDARVFTIGHGCSSRTWMSWLSC
jgi:predicted O-methyltransferase YrrM